MFSCGSAGKRLVSDDSSIRSGRFGSVRQMSLICVCA
jgi:hypothetical protein